MSVCIEYFYVEFQLLLLPHRNIEVLTAFVLFLSSGNFIRVRRGGRENARQHYLFDPPSLHSRRDAYVTTNPKVLNKIQFFCKIHVSCESLTFLYSYISSLSLLVRLYAG